MSDASHASTRYLLLEAIKNSGDTGDPGATKDWDQFFVRIGEIARQSTADPEFRVITVKGERKGVRLEPVFWRALDVVSGELSVSRNELALAIISLGTKEHANSTSLLRSFLVTYLLATRPA